MSLSWKPSFHINVDLEGTMQQRASTWQQRRIDNTNLSPFAYLHFQLVTTVVNLYKNVGIEVLLL